MPNNIAVVIPKYGLIGGAEQYAAELTGTLCSRHHNTFQVFANRWQSDSNMVKFHKIPIISFPKFLTTISFAWFVQRQLLKKNFSLVHSHERIYAADIFTLHGIPHKYWVRHVRNKTMSLYDMATDWMERKLVYEGGCRKFIAVSNLTRDIFLQEYPINADRVVVIHPGVNLDTYEQKKSFDVRNTIRQRLGIAPADPAIIFASMNFEIKGLDNIIFSLAHLKKQKVHFKLIVAGKGNIHKYLKIAQHAQIADDIIFTGPVSKDKLIELYLAGDLYMMLSKFDTFGMVVLEAMAARLPVIISSHVGAKDLVQEGDNGFVVGDTSDYRNIVSKLKILFDENIRKRMSAAAYQTASQHTWDMIAQKYQELYVDILAEKSKQTR
ncbi:MAG: glycosyltransferase family 4 protein [Deltaproteobacteria bacterium]|nr:glycosyltransferase family 4 protein [Deltaproteobacteria bacterium]